MIHLLNRIKANRNTEANNKNRNLFLLGQLSLRTDSCGEKACLDKRDELSDIRSAQIHWKRKDNFYDNFHGTATRA